MEPQQQLLSDFTLLEVNWTPETMPYEDMSVSCSLKGRGASVKWLRISSPEIVFEWDVHLGACAANVECRCFFLRAQCLPY